MSYNFHGLSFIEYHQHRQTLISSNINIVLFNIPVPQGVKAKKVLTAIE